MKIPLRPAPLPPSSKQNMNLHHGTSALDWSDGYVLHSCFIMWCMLKIQSDCVLS